VVAIPYLSKFFCQISRITLDNNCADFLMGDRTVVVTATVRSLCAGSLLFKWREQGRKLGS
jgi:hypothetical protein